MGDWLIEPLIEPLIDWLIGWLIQLFDAFICRSFWLAGADGWLTLDLGLRLLFAL